MAKCLAAHLGGQVTAGEVTNLDFAVAMSARAANSAPWQRLTSYLLGELDNEGSLFLSPLAAAQAGQLLMSTLLLHQPHNYSTLLQAAGQDLSPRYVREAEDFLQSNADQPITADDIARQLNISTRSVYAGFRQHLSTTPMQRLKDIRLERARADLLAGRDGVTVTTVAMAWGFTHLGKFSSDYRARFGELPSHTLRNARSGR
jgi:transcriptional regulator GlxA family with amidase domain